MNWSIYPEYKESALPWIGSIPAHWNLVPNRAFLELQRRPVGSRADSFELLSLTLKGVIIRDISENKGKFPAEFDTYQEVHPGDLVFCLFDIEETPRTVGLSSHEGMITGAYDVFRVLPVADGRYVEYLYLSLDQRKALSYFYSGLRKVIRMPTFKGIRSPLPPLSEQRAIASFLDRETAKIDALIGKQEQLIATLREDRTATITQSVTKGLNLNVEMTDSGVDWIGAVPAHWTVEKGTWIGTTFGSPAVIDTEVQPDGDIAFLKVSSLTRDGLTPSAPVWFVPAGYRAERDFLVFPKRGAAIFTNKVNLIKFPAVLDPNLMGWKMTAGNNPEYYGLILGLLRLEEIADISSVPQLNTKQIASLRLPRPPAQEQTRIVEFLRERCARVDALIAKADAVIETLREYRSALITDAVTGKIDVRAVT